jgi:biopolymer transport protein ExbD
MSHRRKKKKRQMSDVTLNLAAMLDMAFQLLCFFIFTFKPAPVEGDIMLKMPPPMPTVIVKGGEAAGANEENKNPVQGMNSLLISVISNGSGGIETIAVGDAEVPGKGLRGLEQRLKSVLGDSATGFDQVLIQVDQRLHYDGLIQVIGVCNQQKLPDGKPLSKLSFVELPPMGR